VQRGNGEACCRLGYRADGDEVNVGQPARAKKNAGVNDSSSLNTLTDLTKRHAKRSRRVKVSGA